MEVSSWESHRTTGGVSSKPWGWLLLGVFLKLFQEGWEHWQRMGFWGTDLHTKPFLITYDVLSRCVDDVCVEVYKRFLLTSDRYMMVLVSSTNRPKWWYDWYDQATGGTENHDVLGIDLGRSKASGEWSQKEEEGRVTAASAAEVSKRNDEGNSDGMKRWNELFVVVRSSMTSMTFLTFDFALLLGLWFSLNFRGVPGKMNSSGTIGSWSVGYRVKIS